MADNIESFLIARVCIDMSWAAKIRRTFKPMMSQTMKIENRAKNGDVCRFAT